MHYDLTKKNSSAVGYRMRKWYNVLAKNVDAAMRLYIIICALFQVKCRNINVYALISYGLSKFLGDHPSRNFKKPDHSDNSVANFRSF